MINLKPHQQEVLSKLKSGTILTGGVGSGKSLTAIAAYIKSCGGGYDSLDGSEKYEPMSDIRDLYIITTAKKRDDLDWDKECAHFALSRNVEVSRDGVKVVIDSWNNIKRYALTKHAFFIFDEQRLVGSGAWVKTFIKITRNNNNWLLLSATPGDVWMDYVPVFIGNGFYRNRTEFIRRHVVYNNFSKYPKIDHYVEVGRLFRLQRSIRVDMPFERHTIRNETTVKLPYDRVRFDRVMKDRWNVYEDKPIKDVSQLFVMMRKVVNEDVSRLHTIKELLKENPKIIVFYNFNYELEILRTLYDDYNVAEWNGQKHEQIPNSDSWVYLVQYTAGAEGWNCVTTDTIVFYSLNYSHKIMEQARGRIDRMNTPFINLYYYTLESRAPIDIAIKKSLKQKQNFHESNFIRK